MKFAQKYLIRLMPLILLIYNSCNFSDKFIDLLDYSIEILLFRVLLEVSLYFLRLRTTQATLNKDFTLYSLMLLALFI